MGRGALLGLGLTTSEQDGVKNNPWGPLSRQSYKRTPWVIADYRVGGSRGPAAPCAVLTTPQAALEALRRIHGKGVAFAPPPKAVEAPSVHVISLPPCMVSTPATMSIITPPMVEPPAARGHRLANVCPIVSDYPTGHTPVLETPPLPATMGIVAATILPPVTHPRASVFFQLSETYGDCQHHGGGWAIGSEGESVAEIVKGLQARYGGKVEFPKPLDMSPTD